MKCFEVLFTGRVQGVGFRFTAKQLSRSYDIVGTVENLPNGQVKIVAAGADFEVERFIEAICESTHGHVTHIDRTVAKSDGNFASFEIIR